MEQMVLVKGEDIHHRFVGSPGYEVDVPLKKRCAGTASPDDYAALRDHICLASHLHRTVADHIVRSFCGNESGQVRFCLDAEDRAGSRIDCNFSLPSRGKFDPSVFPSIRVAAPAQS
jgi:hypothetical protein